MNSCLTPKAVLFDFDGVILDTAAIETQAFREIYSRESPEKIAAVTAYQERHGGIGRRDKFAYFENELFNRSVSDQRLNLLCRVFSDTIANAMLETKFLPGVLESLAFLQSRASLHLVSGMPEEELLALLKTRGVYRYFSSVAGSPKQKCIEFERILLEGKLEPLEAVAIGGSTTEFEAARHIGIPFIAIVAPSRPDPFPRDIVRCPNLVNLPEMLGFTIKTMAASQ